MATRAMASKGREFSIAVSGPRRAVDTQSGAASSLSSSPSARASDSGMLVKMRAVLSRHQCVQQQEAVSVCMKQNKAQPSAVPCDCSGYINALRYCELATQQHNYPVNTSSFLF